MDSNQISNRAALVTGSAQGIGAAIVHRLSKDGFSVVINYTGQSSVAEALAQELQSGSRQAIAVKADVSDPRAMTALFDKAEAAFGKVDVLVNNAGLMQLSPISETDDAAFDRQIAVNLKGAFNGMREAGRRLRDGGRVISLSSSVVGLYQPTYGIYAATKAGVEAMTHVFSKELKGRQITVNAVAPGPTDTELFRKGKSDQQLEEAAKLSPLQRLGKPEDIARVVSFLAGPDGAWVNGQVIRINGGVI